jgi:cyclic-di-AMP phosphodiesterase PgpH
MNALQSLMRRIELTRMTRKEDSLTPTGKWGLAQDIWGLMFPSSNTLTPGLNDREQSPSSLEGELSTDKQISVSKSPKSSVKKKARSRLLLVVAIASLTGTMGQRFYNQPKLNVGTIAPTTIKAPRAVSIPDLKTTEEKRNEARIGAVPILMRDPNVEKTVLHELEEILKTISLTRKIAGSFPFVSTDILSTDVQQHLRQCPEEEWRSLLNWVETQAKIPSRPNSEKENAPKDNTKLSGEKLYVVSPRPTGVYNSPNQVNAITQILAYRRTVSAQELPVLLTKISQARANYLNALDALDTLKTTFPNEQGHLYNESLFNVSDAVWQKTEVGINRVAQRMLTQGIAQGLPHELLEEGIHSQLQGEVPSENTLLATQILNTVLQPNLVRDALGTRQLAELAAQKVKPVIVKVQQGDILVNQGEIITQDAFVVLDYLGLSRRQVNWRGLIVFVGGVTTGVGIVILVEKCFHSGLRRRDHLLLVLLSLSAPVLITLQIPATSLPAIGILISSFYGAPLAVTVVGVISILLPIGMDVNVIQILTCCVGGLLGAFLAEKMRSREELALLGGAVGLSQAVFYLIVTLIVSATAGSIWYALLGAAALQGLVGLAWSIIALGLSPYLEHVFDLITPIRLAELANPNRPLLKRLAAEAPGTFQHTLFVASLAEAAAREINCNVELVRTGTLYHDIGKMHDPMAFCENQMGGMNKHDEINDPWVSTDIIKKHVSEGILMAKKYRLPKAIRAFIPEHQGSMLIAYFYYYAQQRASEGTGPIAREEDFRYPGPIPQSRETGIVMLADSCEAALRSLKDASHDEALQMVNRILRARWQDHQLDDSGLTREDLSIIAEVFVRVWEQFNHKRIAYPKPLISPR